MAKSPINVRAISADECAVLRKAVTCAPAESADVPSLDRLDSLQIVGRCQCGCASVEFRHLKLGEIAEVVADAIGETDAGERVGILVFALDGNFVELEIFGYSDTPARLPVVSTIRGWADRGPDSAA
jgi:hypothetical protein